EIYNLYFQKIYRFIYYRVGHKEMAEDLAEEVFLKAFTKIASVSENSAFLGWLYQIARNQVIDYYREKKLVVALDEIENTLEYETNVIDVVNLQQQQKVLLKLMKELMPEQQIVLKLKFFEDLENSEIAEMLHKNEGTIRVIQHRAIAKLQELIKKLENDK
ncbi:MAG: RNA polymerase sigma factor, partial [Candidatus Paceibacterales bacterium]